MYPSSTQTSRQLSSISRTRQRFYSEARLLPIRHAELFVFEYSDDFEQFLRLVDEDQLARVQASRIGTNREATLLRSLNLDTALWEKLPAPRRLEITPKKVSVHKQAQFTTHLRTSIGARFKFLLFRQWIISISLSIRYLAS